MHPHILLAITTLCAGSCFSLPSLADLPQTIARVKPSVVAIATFQKTRSPALNFIGTGFVIGDGLQIATNAHVIPELLNFENMESLVIVARKGEKDSEIRSAEKIAHDKNHDLAVLKISGAPLPALSLANSDLAQEGQQFAFTGFPIGMVLGFHAVTHQAMLSAITPLTQPVWNSQQLNNKLTNQLKKPVYDIFQLDGTAYPGNSGSPLYDVSSGEVYGIINMVFVKGAKEHAISQPSGITYAIPVKHLQSLLKQH